MDATPSVSTDRLRECGAHTLGDNASPEARQAVLRRWAAGLNGSDPLTIATERAALRETYEIPVYMITAAIKSYVDAGAQDDEQGTSVVLEDPERWPEPVDGQEVLKSIVGALARFVALPPGGYTAVALWILHAHAHSAALVSPILALLSPVKRCGKSTLLDVLAALVPKPLKTSHVTPAVIFRVVDAHHPTCLFDEADTFIRNSEELRGVLNSGHARGGAFTHRCEGEDHEVRAFSTWAPKAIAAIGRLPETLEDRAIKIRMRRRRPDERVARFRLDRAHQFESLRRQAWTWAQDHLEELREADPEMPDALDDRQQDNWRPLCAIADLIGGPWPEKAREAALLTASQEPEQENSAAVQLIEDVVAMFVEKDADSLPSADICDDLEKMEDRPWPEWKNGKPITPRQVAKLLKPFQIVPKKIRFELSAKQGYERAAFDDAVHRYLDVPDTEQQCSGYVPDRKSPNSLFDNVVPDVPDREGGAPDNDT
jgi:hypothetical protein